MRLPAQLFAVPIALVSLVEEHTAQFPGNVGLPEAGRINTLADLVRWEDAAGRPAWPTARRNTRKCCAL